MPRHCWLFSLLLIATQVCAEGPRLIIQRAPLAGFTHHAAGVLLPQLHEGDVLTLIREADNAHDNLAVRVDWQNQALGYLARTDNGAVARALDRGTPLLARISRLREHPNPRQRIEVEVSALIPPRP